MCKDFGKWPSDVLMIDKVSEPTLWLATNHTVWATGKKAEIDAMPKIEDGDGAPEPRTVEEIRSAGARQSKAFEELEALTGRR